MDFAIFVPLIQNAAFLLALSVIFEIVYGTLSRYRRAQPILTGVLISLICYCIMALPYTLQPGLVFDTRSILISVTALIFGLVPTLITVLTAVAYRLSAGGIGTLPGILVIVSCALIGLLWRHFWYPKSRKQRWLNVLLMSVTVHLVMLACMLPMPYPQNVETIRVIALPVLTVYPVTAALLSLLLLRQTDTKKLQRELKSSEERFRTLFDKAPLGYQSLDMDGRFLEVNQQWLDMFGYTRQEVIGEWFGDFLSPNCVEDYRGKFDVFKAKGAMQYEFVMITKSGEERHIRFVGKIRNDEHGEPLRTHSILQDVTAQRLAQADVRLSEAKYRQLFETMSQGVVHQSADGTIVSANPAAQRILGLTTEQMLGKTSMDSLWQTIREDGSELLGDNHPSMIALRTGKPFGPCVLGVYQPERKDYIWLSVTATPLFNPGEKTPYQVYTLFEDVTAERKARQNYQTLFNEMMDAFAVHEIILDDQGKPVDYRFLAVNPAFESMTGLKADDIIGKTVLEVIPNLEPYWIEIYGKVALTGETVQFENFSIGTGKHFAISAFRPKPMQFACTFIDITQRVVAETALQESKKRYASYIQNAPIGIMIADETGRIVEANAAAERLSGYPMKALLKTDIAGLVDERQTDDALRLLYELSTKDSISGELQWRHFDGTIRWTSFNAVKLNPKRFLYFVSDITEKKTAADKLIYVNNHDDMTGLWNRKHFGAEAERLNTPDYLPLSVIIGDINGLKLINDSFGRAEGDRVIVETAAFLRGFSRPGDVVARTGGDEFSMILPGTNQQEAEIMLAGIQFGCNEYNKKIADDSLHINLSLGAATRTTMDEAFVEVLKAAENSMNQRKLLEIKSSHSSIIATIKATMREKSHETEAHEERMAEMARKVGVFIGLSVEEINNMVLLAELHDIGKIGISEQILNKPGKLDPDEWAEMKKHPEIGERIALSTSSLAPIAKDIRCHHERWDGTGYPQGLKGDEIPLLSRILAVVDAYDAMTEDRVYQKARSHDDAILEIRRCAGTQFDPEIARVFCEKVFHATS
jgi:diguanylate cyclase (GGDEF)-like protein/PAS domain S-box-containing protein